MEKICSFWAMKNAISKILKPYFKRGGSHDRQKFADHIGVSLRTVINILNGDTSLTMDQVVKASDFLQVDLFQEFFKEIGRPQSRPVEEAGNNYQTMAPAEQKITINLTIQAPLKSYNKLPELLNVIKEKGLPLGFEIS